VTLVLSDEANENPDEVAYLREQLRSDLVKVSVGGSAAANADVNHQVKKDLVRAEVVSFLVLAVLLVFVFRGLVAAALPLALGGFAIFGALFLTRLLSQVTSISQYAVNIITLLGLGLAIDYSLFIVSRFREELRHSPRNVPKALTHTMETAGHTVFFSGLTVAASLLCLQIFPIDFLRSMSFGGIAAVLVALAAAMLVLPAILRLLGTRVNALSFGRIQTGHVIKERPNLWYRLGSVFMRRHWTSTIVVGGLLLAAALPFLRVHFSTPDYSSLPVGSEARYVSARLASEFGAPGAPIRILYTAPGDLKNGDRIAALYGYVQSIRVLSEVGATTSIVDIPGISGAQAYRALYAGELSGPVQAQYEQRVHSNTTMIDVSYKDALDADTTQKLVEKLRGVAQPGDVQVVVGGGPAVLHDLLATIRTYIPYGLLILVTTLFVLLFLLSRSFVIAGKAILMSALSLGTAFGALVWVFQEGHWASALHLTPTGSIDATLPVLIFAIAFGLSVDYSVFLYSRIREQYDANGGDNTDAVLTGLQKTGSIITSAATLLFIVVAAFATGRIPLMQQIGVGLALTVLIDAFIIRMVLVPSLMGILGPANWWAPKIFRRRSSRSAGRAIPRKMV
jgi:RND superfamily putative drug exporter